VPPEAEDEPAEGACGFCTCPGVGSTPTRPPCSSLPEFLPDLVVHDAVVFSFKRPSAGRSYTTSSDPIRPGTTV